MKTALVLSGGGALGSYEVGVWQALRKLHIKFDIVTGTSVGALNAIMVTQNDFHKCMNVWQDISFANIYATKIDSDIKLNKLYQMHAKEFIKNGGMNPAMLEQLVKDVYDKEKFYKSKIDYGLITFNLSTFKPKKLTKKDIPPEKLVDYAVASATCYPAFKIKTIDNEKYIDGGFYDNVPIQLAIDMGADNVIVVDLQAVGFKRKVKNFSGNMTIIKPNNKLMNMLEFNAEKSRRAIKLGYNDTMKKYKMLDGIKFTFKKNNLEKNYKKTHASFKKYLQNDLSSANALILKKYSKFLNDGNDSKKEFDKLVENCGNVLMLPDEEIYDINKFNKLLKKELVQINLDEEIKFDKNINDIKKLLDKRKIIKHIYIVLEKEDYNKKIINTIVDIFSKEYLIALYLKSIK
ncbi:MAG TPA: patatin-like phospholipase family protein [Bacilli bacterium]|nr:patatin-like phospholipase family protein [Bacilli bacterium]